jgi:hypothetical protein
MDQLTVDARTPRSQSASPADVMGAPASSLGAAPTVLFREPSEVLAHPALASSEKRALPASWASDACTVENLPNWRKLPATGALVPLDEILDALRVLDGATLH